eukprot:TRINITY_DN31646_c0_g3_i1.p1 TRINITY_DN31646_c0_g3~~TRINITY_DN31646_c0_g3_i1.p1  ORF type:complete len:498 (+),score=57.29 TRINITY_DN31646_c0_g3_i1:198-1691(+)
MVHIEFLHPNVFNVLKYIAFSLTIGCLVDIVLHAFMCHYASRALLKKGRYSLAPPHTSFRTYRYHGSHFLTFIIICIAAALEMALDFSTGATTIQTTSIQTFRISTKVSNVTQLSNASSDYISQLRHALQRVEGACFNIPQRWYSPVSFNLTHSFEFSKMADAALCPQNRSIKVNATSIIAQSSFRASHILHTNIWNRSELMVGRDTQSEEQRLPYDQVGDVTIGALHQYNFMVANFSGYELVPGSERPITGNTSHQSPWAKVTARFRIHGVSAVECLMSVKSKRDEQTSEWIGRDIFVQACLVPITENRSVLAKYDEDVGTQGESSLIMLVALRGATTFHDLRVLKAIPFLFRSGNRMHSLSELSVLAVLCSEMITALSTDGLQNVRMVVDGELVTVPTWSVWGIVLFFVGVAMLVVLKVAVAKLTSKLKVRGNVVTAKGIAEHWLLQNENSERVHGRVGRVVLVPKAKRRNGEVTVGVQRMNGFSGVSITAGCDV